MTPDFAVWVCKQTIYTALIISAPMLLAGLVVGLVISIFQAATQVNEMTLSFIPKIIAVVVALLLTLPWAINTMIAFTQQMFSFVAAGIQ